MPHRIIFKLITKVSIFPQTFQIFSSLAAEKFFRNEPRPSSDSAKRFSASSLEIGAARFRRRKVSKIRTMAIATSPNSGFGELLSAV